MNKPLRIGIVGLGKMGAIRHREISRRTDAVVVSGTDPDEALKDTFPDISLLGSYEEVIGSDVDAIFVCTPNRFTADIVISALDAGKHVFAEKPPGRTVQDIERIIEAESRNPHLKLKFGFNHRYHAGIREAKRLVEGGRLGKILWVRGVYGKSGGKGFEGEWRSSKEISGGGILLDQGIHMLDLFHYFCGSFVEVKSMVTTAFWNVDTEDNAFALLRDESGRIAMLHSSSTQWKHRFNLEVYMSEGYVSVNGILSSTRSYGDETVTVAHRRFDDGFATGKPREEVIYFDTDPSWELEVAEFVEAVAKNIDIKEGTSSQAHDVMGLVFRIYDADEKWKSGNMVEESAEETVFPTKRKLRSI